MIYEFVFGDMMVDLHPHTNKGGLFLTRPDAPGLLMASKQTHAEAIRLFYTISTFNAGNIALCYIERWMKSIGPARKNLIRHVVILPCQLPGTDLCLKRRFWEVGCHLQKRIQLVEMQLRLPPAVVEGRLILTIYGSICTASE